MEFLGRKRNRDLMEKIAVMNGDAVIAKKPLSIYIPQRFVTRQLARIGSTISTIGMFAIATEDEYTLSSITGFVYLGASQMNEVTIDNDTYLEFKFQKGSIVITTAEVTQDDSLLYSINEEFIARGRLPSYYKYEDLPLVFQNAKHFTGVTIGANSNTMDFFYSLVGRDASDLATPTRASENDRIELIGLRSISLTAPSSLTRISGSYMSEGLVTSLTNRTESLEKIEEMILS